MLEVYSYCAEKTRHIIEESESPICPDCDTLILPSHFSLYESTEEQLDDASTPVGEPIGCIDGFLVLGRELELELPLSIENSDMFMNLICDDLSADLGFVVSALLKDGGPLSQEHTVFGFDHFYLDEIELKRPELLPHILRELPKIVFRHMHIYPDIISFHPRPLPYEPEPRTEQQKMLMELAERTKSAIMHLMMQGNYHAENPQAVLTPEQVALLYSIQQNGTNYPAQYVDIAVWQPFLDAGFREWQNTRVLYRIIDRDA